jgi:hypothetical protein
MRRLTALLLLLPLVGCFTVRHRYSGDKVLTSASTVEGRTGPTVRHFDVHDRQFFWLHGGFPVGEDLNAAALAAREAGAHDAVVNLRLADGQDLVDMGVTHVLCVLSLLCGTWSTWAEGDVVDFVENER